MLCNSRNVKPALSEMLTEYNFISPFWAGYKLISNYIIDILYCNYCEPAPVVTLIRDFD